MIEREPDWSARLPETTPEVVRRLLERCLRKDVRRRLRDIADARIEIDDAMPLTPAVRNQPIPRRSRRWVLIGWIAAVALASAVVVTWRLWVNDYFWQNPLADARPVRLTDFEGEEVDAAISPDGKFMVFLSNRDGPLDVFVSQIGSGAFTNLTKGDFRPATWAMVRETGFSGDGEQVWFMLGPQPGSTDASTLMGPTMGGIPKLFLDRGRDPAWSPDGKTLAYYKPDPGDPIFIADGNASNPQKIFAAEPGVHCHFLIWSRDGRFVYFVKGTPTTDMDIWRIPARGGQRRADHVSSCVGGLPGVARCPDLDLLGHGRRRIGAMALRDGRRTSHPSPRELGHCGAVSFCRGRSGSAAPSGRNGRQSHRRLVDRADHE